MGRTWRIRKCKLMVWSERLSVTILVRGLVLLSLCTFAAGTSALASDSGTALLEQGSTKVPLTQYARIVRDDGARLSADAFLDRQACSAAPDGREFISLGSTRDALWLCIPLHNGESTPLQRLLVFDPSWLEDLQVLLYQQHDLVQSFQLGALRPFAERTLAQRLINHEVSIPPGDSLLLVRAQSRDPVDVNLTLWEQGAYFEAQSLEAIFWGATYGILGAMLLYNLFLYVSVRDRIYVAYAVYLLMFLMLNATLNGQSYQYFWPDSPSLNKWVLTTSVYAYALSGIYFGCRFLDLRSRLPVAYRMARGAAGVMVGSFVLTALLNGYRWNILLAPLWVIVSAMFMVTVGFLSLRRGNRAARYFLIGTVSGFIGSSTTACTTLGFLPFTFWTYRAVDFGMVVDAILLSFALADRISIIRKDKDIAYAKVKEINEHLEERVNQRTHELEMSKAEAEYGSNELRTLIERMPIGFIVWDRDFRVKSWNPAATDIFGYSEKETMGRQPYGLIVSESDQPTVAEIWERLIKGDMTAYSINKNLTKDGRSITCSWTNTPLLTSDGLVTSLLSMVQDITQQKQSEILMHQWSNAFNNAALGIALGDVDTQKIIACNPSFAQILKSTVDKQIGMPILENYAPAERNRVRQLITHAVDVGSFSYESTMLRTDGTEIPVQVDLVAVRDAEGKPSYRVATIQDISERRQAIQKLEEKELAKTRFLASAGHDLRQPLAAANLFIDALNFTELSAEQHKMLRSLEQSMATFNELLDALLNISKLDAGSIKPEYTSISVIDLMNWLSQSFAGLAASKGLVLKVRLPEQRPLAVLSDLGLIRSVLMNLVSNAIKFTDTGGILIGVRRRGDNLLFQVWDSGIGIPPENIERIFTEFYQVDNPQRDRTKGLGLGLAIARRALNLLGSEIMCFSRTGHGTVFEFALPVCNTMDDVIQIDEGLDKDNLVNFVRGKYFVVVEDDKLVAEAIISMFEGLGAEVRHFHNGEDALKFHRIGQADCYVVDFMVGGAFDGIQLLDKLQQMAQRRIAAVLVTGDTSSMTLRYANRHDWPVLHKPVSTSRLIAELRSQYESHQNN